ncbi:MAG: preprotein translocase subunit YajC [Rhodospirillales bacterium]|jgi:preprotein translocase subunit YajC|nr:preprotein translocase subunit YajC [Rhodospirillales bacterium]MDP6883282.1 preprotein translocase subunit YajC [Rhodospirillales bacterium]
MFVSPAYAQAAAGGGSGFEALLPLVLIFVVFYFLLIRPQQKKMKQHKEMLGAVRRGDKVVTGGGIIGTVTRVVDDNELSVEIAKGVRVKVQRATISGILAKTEPAKGAAKDGGKGGKDGKEPDAEGPVTRSGGSASGLKALLGGKDR